ncbi:MAG TPA: glycosyl hydrolase family 28 protein [Polyangia bacterium]|nr:glycosyl hydrolase family 28 protein [Polyangia bacterium]
MRPIDVHHAHFALVLGALLAGGCHLDGDPTPLEYSCGTAAEAAQGIAGTPDDCSDIDAILPPEPSLPPDPADASCILAAQQQTTDTSWLPDETSLDTARLRDALGRCKVVKLVTAGADNAFVSGPLTITSATLWVDKGVTLYASRNPDNYQIPGHDDCGKVGVNDSGACQNFLTVGGAAPGIVGDGVIDGQGGEPLLNQQYSWWQLSGALQSIDGSIGNPTLINLTSGTTQFLLYRITLHNSPKFHVKITSNPPGGPTAPCTTQGSGFIVWGVTVLTPSRWLNSQGLEMSPHFARNTDGIDPGETALATCGVLVHNTISTGDDHIAIKGGHGVNNIIVAHNHFGTGHGMSIGSETYGGVHGLTVCDLTIDADSRPVGNDASPGDFNGIRVKSDASRGGVVDGIVFRNVCMRDVNNAILVSTAYNPLFSGTLYPQFGAMTFHDIHGVTCMNTRLPVVTLNGFSTLYPAGPITLDNVAIDNLSPGAVESEYANIVLGPGDVNFTPGGPGVTVTSNVAAGSSAPIHCVFPPLPAPQPPPGWLR